MILQINTDSNGHKQVVAEWYSLQDIANNTSHKVDGIMDAIECKTKYQGCWWVRIKE